MVADHEASAATLLFLAPTRAQQLAAGGPPAPVAHQNLQVLAKDMPQTDLIQVMQGFTQGLGVHAVRLLPCGGPAD